MWFRRWTNCTDMNNYRYLHREAGKDAQCDQEAEVITSHCLELLLLPPNCFNAWNGHQEQAKLSSQWWFSRDR
jgi:hypothetical protein